MCAARSPSVPDKRMVPHGMPPILPGHKAAIEASADRRKCRGVNSPVRGLGPFPRRNSNSPFWCRPCSRHTAPKYETVPAAHRSAICADVSSTAWQSARSSSVGYPVLRCKWPRRRDSEVGGREDAPCSTPDAPPHYAPCGHLSGDSGKPVRRCRAAPGSLRPPRGLTSCCAASRS
jgi:hypothetical protein